MISLRRYGYFSDAWRGSGWFISWNIPRGFLLLAFRPRDWALRYHHSPLQPWVRRLYLGPFEVELSWYKARRSRR